MVSDSFVYAILGITSSPRLNGELLIQKMLQASGVPPHKRGLFTNLTPDSLRAELWRN